MRTRGTVTPQYAAHGGQPPPLHVRPTATAPPGSRTSATGPRPGGPSAAPLNPPPEVTQFDPSDRTSWGNNPMVFSGVNGG